MCSSRAAQDQGAWESALGTCLDLNCQETAPCRPLLLDQLHVPLWALASRKSGCRGWSWMRSRKWMGMCREQGAEYKGGWWKQERQAGVWEREMCVVWQCCDSFSLSKQPFVTTYLEKIKQNFGSVKHFQKTLSAVSTLKMKDNLTKQNGHHRYYSDVVLHS